MKTQFSLLRFVELCCWKAKTNRHKIYLAY